MGKPNVFNWLPWLLEKECQGRARPICGLGEHDMLWRVGAFYFRIDATFGWLVSIQPRTDCLSYMQFESYRHADLPPIPELRKLGQSARQQEAQQTEA